MLQVKGIRALLVSKYYNLSRAVGHLFYARHKFWVNFFHQKLKRYGLFHHVQSSGSLQYLGITGTDVGRLLFI